MTHNEIIAAGAPVLGFGRFYREDAGLAYGFYTISIRSLGEFYGSTTLAEAMSYPEERHTPADVAKVAARAFGRI